MGDTRADETPPPVMLSPTSSRLGSHVEGLRLAVAAKLPPLLICLRGTRQLHGEKREERETEVGGGEGE